MNKKENLFTPTLRLNLNNTQDMEAWNNLMSTDRNQPEYSSYSRTIVIAINDRRSRFPCRSSEREMVDGHHRVSHSRRKGLSFSTY